MFEKAIIYNKLRGVRSLIFLRAKVMPESVLKSVSKINQNKITLRMTKIKGSGNIPPSGGIASADTKSDKNKGFMAQ